MRVGADYLEVICWDWNRVGKRSFMGHLIFPLSKLKTYTEYHGDWYKLDRTHIKKVREKMKKEVKEELKKLKQEASKGPSSSSPSSSSSSKDSKGSAESGSLENMQPSIPSAESSGGADTKGKKAEQEREKETDEENGKDYTKNEEKDAERERESEKDKKNSSDPINNNTGLRERRKDSNPFSNWDNNPLSPRKEGTPRNTTGGSGSLLAGTPIGLNNVNNPTKATTTNISQPFSKEIGQWHNQKKVWAPGTRFLLFSALVALWVLLNVEVFTRGW